MKSCGRWTGRAASVPRGRRAVWPSRSSGSTPRGGVPRGEVDTTDPEVPGTSPSSDAGAPPVFISYSSRDGTEHARQLRETLGRNGVRAWLCPNDLDLGRDFTSELEQAIEGARVVVVCITAGAILGTSYV